MIHYKLPVGANECEIVISGEPAAQDFDDLIEYLRLMQRQFERRDDAVKSVEEGV